MRIGRIDNCDVIGSATGDNATVPHTLEKCDVSPILYASVGRRSPRHDSACPSNKAVRPTVRRALVESTRTISATISGTISSSPSRALRSSRALPEIVADSPRARRDSSLPSPRALPRASSIVIVGDELGARLAPRGLEHHQANARRRFPRDHQPLHQGGRGGARSRSCARSCAPRRRPLPKLCEDCHPIRSAGSDVGSSSGDGGRWGDGW